EDGIRDPLVTGVQTCALPIYSMSNGCPEADVEAAAKRSPAACASSLNQSSAAGAAIRRGMTRRRVTGPRSAAVVGELLGSKRSRSEERRVGKECRAEWWSSQS